MLLQDMISFSVFALIPQNNDIFAAKLAMNCRRSTVYLPLFYCFIQYNLPIDKPHGEKEVVLAFRPR